MANLDLPNEITTIILSNLPVKSLLRFKCVSKPWNSWISSRRRQGAIAAVYQRYSTPSFRFINQQLTLEELNYDDIYTSSDDDIYTSSDDDIYTSSDDDIYTSSDDDIYTSSDDDIYTSSDDDIYTSSDDDIYWHLGSCDGLILIHRNEHIYLWNPATQFYTKVLELDRLNEDGYSICGGLCFDSSKNVYKAVLIMRHQTPDYGGEFVIVASLKDKRWRRTVKFPYHIRSVRDGITLHGRLHYRVRVKKKDQSMWDRFGPCNEIIYFDPISEKFHMFPNTDQGENAIVGLGVLNECLCMTCLDNDKGGVEILIMKEYGVKESWTSLFFIRNLEINPSYGFVMPLFMAGDGELVLEIYHHNSKIVIYNPKNDNMRDVVIDGENTNAMIENTNAMINYVESLISPKVCYWNEEKHKKFGQLI